MTKHKNKTTEFGNRDQNVSSCNLMVYMEYVIMVGVGVGVGCNYVLGIGNTGKVKHVRKDLEIMGDEISAFEKL